MKYNLVYGVNSGLERQLSDFGMSVLSTISGSKIDLIDGLKLDIEESRLLTQKNVKEYGNDCISLLFNSESKRKFAADLMEKFNSFVFYEIGEGDPELEIEKHDEDGKTPYNKFCVEINDNYKYISFVDGKNVVRVKTLNQSQYVVSIYTNVADVTEHDGLIPDDGFIFSYFINSLGQGELVYSGSQEKLCTLFPVMGDQNPIYLMWRIGRAVNSLYTQSYEEENSKQLTRSCE